MPAAHRQVGLEGDGAELAKALLDGVDRPVVDQPPGVDDDHPLAQLLDVAQVVGGEDDGGALVAVLLPDELADALLDDQVQPDGGLVQVDDLRLVDQGGGQLGAHLLPERHVADRHVQQLFQLQGLGELVEQLLVAGRLHLVDAWPPG